MNLGGVIHITKTGFCLLFGSVIILVIYLLPDKHVNIPTISKQTINLKQLLSAAIQAAENGGKEILNIKNIEISSKGKTREGANDSVTTADFKSHCIMTNTIKKIFPTLNIVSEEEVLCSSESSLNDLILVNLSDKWVSEKDVTVWIDPLDATQEYTEKLMDYVTTMVCVAVNGKPIIGVIHKPFKKTTVWAWMGIGHSSNLVPNLSLNKTKFKFIVSRSHTGKVKETIHMMFNNGVEQIITAGGAGYKVLKVINGNADFYLHVTAIKKWDICAGNAILNEVGGRMTTLHGKEISYADANDVVNEEGLIATLQPVKINFV